MEIESDTSAVFMPIWVAVYLAAYVTFSLWAFKDDLSQRRLTVMDIVELLGSVSLVLATLAYWHLPIGSPFLNWAAWLFIIGIFAFVLFAVNKIVTSLSDTGFSRGGVFSVISGIGFLVLVNLPLIWFGGRLLFNIR